MLFDGTAGPYPVRVIVRPPEVVPGRAEVIVRVDAPDVERVVIRPVFWRAGVAGAPAGDELRRIAGQERRLHGQLWLMAYGAYSVYVTVIGRARIGHRDRSRQLVRHRTPSVVARARRHSRRARRAAGRGDRHDHSRGVGRESRPAGRGARRGAAPSRESRDGDLRCQFSRLIVFGGAKWWSAEDAGYRRFMYGSPAVDVTVGDGDASNAPPRACTTRRRFTRSSLRSRRITER